MQIVGLSRCIGYVSGYADASVIYEHLLNGNTATNINYHPFACGLEKVDKVELVKDVVRYMDQKPSTIEKHPSLIMMTVLGVNYPCVKSN